MATPGTVLSFPGGRDNKKDKKESSVPLTHQSPPMPAIDSYDYDETVSLYQIATSVKKKAEDLVLFVEQNRSVARQAGVEMLAVQLNSILEGEKFQRVVDSLEDGVYRRVPVSLTQDGVDKVHRMERLIADADSVIVHFMNGRKIEPGLGQTQPSAYPMAPYPMYAPAPSSDMSGWMPVIIISIAGIVGVIAILALAQQSRKP